MAAAVTLLPLPVEGRLEPASTSLTSPVAFAVVPASTVAGAVGLTASSTQPDCEILCDDTVEPWCDADEHLAWNPDEPGVTWVNAMRRQGSHPTSCFDGSCESEHDAGQCQARMLEPPLTSENTADLREAVADADVTEVQALLKAHPSQLSFNVKRSAIQVTACNGRLREHMPLPDRLARQLVAAAH